MARLSPSLLIAIVRAPGRAVATAFAAVFALMAAALPASAIDIQRVVSPKGIEAWLVSENTLPLVTMSFSFRGGATQDPAGKPGVSNMISGLLDEGAGELDSQAFQTALANSSIRMSFDAGRDAFYGSLRVLSESRDEATRLLRLALTKPRFDSEPIDRIRAQIEAGIRSEETDPETIAGIAWMRAAFPNHPYGRESEGTLESLPKVTVDDLRAYHRRVFARDNLRIAVVGAIDAAALGKVLDEIFGDLPAKADLVAVADVAPSLGARIVADVSVPQTVIRFGGNGLKRKDPDFIPAFVANHILGGGAFSSRLYSEVREKRGYAYSIGSGLSPMDHSALFVGGTATRADRADAALELIEAEVKKFAAEGPTEKEVENAKSYIIGSYALRFNSSSSIASQLLAIQMDDLGIDYINRRNDLVRAVTVADVKRAAQKVFGNGALIIARVGPAPKVVK